MIFGEISKWLDNVLEDVSTTGIPTEAIAFGFNLYDDDGAKNLIGNKY